MKYKSCAHFFIVSNELTPTIVCQRLGIKCDEVILKGALNPSGKPKVHPFNLVIFHSRMSYSAEMQKHAEDLLSRISPIMKKIKELPKSCNASLNFEYKMGADGGWAFSPSILATLAKLDVPCVFSVSRDTKVAGIKKRLPTGS